MKLRIVMFTLVTSTGFIDRFVVDVGGQAEIPFGGVR